MPSSADTAIPPTEDLAALRTEIDRIDDALHDLLMQRAAVVTKVAVSGKGRVALRPGREANILRRLLARNRGALPGQGLVRIWRELLAATTSMQGPYIIAVCEPEANAAFTQTAREHFGALTQLRVHRSWTQALRDISAGTASVAVLPLPREEDAPRDVWWTALLQKDEPRIHVIARLPFWTPRPDSAPDAQALVLAAIAPDPTENDRSLLGMELPLDVSRTRATTALTDAGFALGTVILRRDPGAAVAYALADVAGHVTEVDPRLDVLRPILRRPVVLGAYAVPLGTAA
jgi:chorismate mutase/prephenate dehydratase